MGTMTCCPHTFSVCLLSCCFQTYLFIRVSDQQQYWQRKGHKERKQQSARCEEKRKNGEETGGGGAEQQPQVTGKHTKQKKMSSKTYFMYSLCVCVRLCRTFLLGQLSVKQAWFFLKSSLVIKTFGIPGNRQSHISSSRNSRWLKIQTFTCTILIFVYSFLVM